jgi:hypothetical protein
MNSDFGLDSTPREKEMMFKRLQLTNFMKDANSEDFNENFVSSFGGYAACICGAQSFNFGNACLIIGTEFGIDHIAFWSAKLQLSGVMVETATADSFDELIKKLLSIIVDKNLSEWILEVASRF